MALVSGTAPFCLDRTEVRVRDYRACVAAKACEASQGEAGLRDGQPVPGEACNAAAKREDHPQNCVSFRGAEDYCAWRGARLPSADEWELAATGGDPKRRYPWGPGEPNADTLCWSGGGVPRRTTTCPAGATPGDVGPFGHLDLGGNVREWTATDVREAPGVARGIVTPVQEGHAFDDDRVFAVGASRSGDDPRTRVAKQGFRCAASPR